MFNKIFLRFKIRIMKSINIKEYKRVKEKEHRLLKLSINFFTTKAMNCECNQCWD